MYSFIFPVRKIQVKTCAIHKWLNEFIFRAECYDYLFEMACLMKQHGLDPASKPIGN